MPPAEIVKVNARERAALHLTRVAHGIAVSDAAHLQTNDIGAALANQIQVVGDDIDGLFVDQAADFSAMSKLLFEIENY